VLFTALSINIVFAPAGNIEGFDDSPNLYPHPETPRNNKKVAMKNESRNPCVKAGFMYPI
jgi:hypothetical protein